MRLQPAVVKFGGKKVLLMVTQKDSYRLGPMLFLTKTIMVQPRKIKREKQFFETKVIFQELHLAGFHSSL